MQRLFRLSTSMTGTIFRDPLNFSLLPAQIHESTTKSIAEATAIYDQIAKLTPQECNFNSVAKAISIAEGKLACATASSTFLQFVASEKPVRDASAEANELLDKFRIDQGMRMDLYQATLNAQSKEENLLAEDKRLLEKLVLEFKRDGLSLPVEKRERLLQLRKRLSELSIKFNQNMNEEKSTITFTAKELDGVSKDFLDSLKCVSSEDSDVLEYQVTMKYPDYFGIMKNAKSSETRRKMELANGSKTSVNIPLLEEALKIRKECAKLLGYKDHASYQLEIKMAKTTDTVNKFLQSLSQKLVPKALEELKDLISIKKEENPLFPESEQKIHPWDFHYYIDQLLKIKYSVNEEKIMEYFDLENTTKKMLRIYETVLGIQFTEVENPHKWHEDVKLFNVHDMETQSLLGQFYLDLHPREGKYTHAACFGLLPGWINETGKREFPVSAMVANFTKPTPTKPSLLKYKEVVTYFHELGHVMHQICAQTKYSRFHGTNVEPDFVEAPSQMLENWCWELDLLHNLSCHYENQEKLPLELVENLIKSKNVCTGLFYLRQVFFSVVDMYFHTSDEIDTVKVWSKLRKEISLIESQEGTCPAASFGHIMGGYDAGYYGYLWSQVYSADMFFSKFKPEGVMSPKIGMAYRKKILQPGGSIDANLMIMEFLGRKPNDEAFLKSIGL